MVEAIIDLFKDGACVQAPHPVGGPRRSGDLGAPGDCGK